MPNNNSNEILRMCSIYNNIYKNITKLKIVENTTSLFDSIVKLESFSIHIFTYSYIDFHTRCTIYYIL